MIVGSVFRRRNRNGCTIRRRSAAANSSLNRSTGSTNCCRKCSRLPKYPGLRNSMMLHNSSRRFSTGVPVSATRKGCEAAPSIGARECPVNRRIACVCLADGFLMFCASSKIRSLHSCASNMSISRRAMPKLVITMSFWDSAERKSSPLSLPLPW